MKITYAAIVVAAVLMCCGRTNAAMTPPPVPDLTNDGKPDGKHDWTLGPTGARGWIWGWRGQTTNARQILITEVAPGSPADGVLRKNDVLLGVNGTSFNDDARIALAKAITEAEKKTGVLALTRWRAGQTQNVQLKLPVMGAYSSTAPYDCAKSNRILEQGCAAIAKRGFKDQHGVIQIEIANALRALALLASGHAEYRPLVAEYAKAVTVCTPSQGGHKSWDYGYETLLLAEYALATKDASVMPGLTRLSTDIAHGASRLGTWGHTFARSDGIIPGYGCMNAVGVSMTLAMVVAREAGVKDPDLDRTIAKASGFLRWFVGKGALPYGDTYPQQWHDDNGKCSCAGVIFDALGDREAALFFSRMATAAYAEREAGHTGNFFGMLWALPGVARCGPLATGAYLKETDWYYDLARGWDGRFLFQGAPANWGGMGEQGWDCTGAYMLAYALPLKLTVLTGRKPSVVPALSREAVAETIAAGRDFSFWTMENPYEGRDTESLFAGLSSWSPAVRKRSASALGRREGDFVPRLLTLLDSPDRDTRCGACEALACLGPKADPAASRLRGLLTDPDPWLRTLAAEAIRRLGRQQRTAAIPDLLRAVARNDPADRRKSIQGALADALFVGGPDYFYLPFDKRDPKATLSGSLDGVDRPLLYAAIKDILKNDNGWVVSQVAPVYKLLAPQDAAALLPDIVRAIRTPPASGEMFANVIRVAGGELLARLRIREGMELIVDVMPERFGWHNGSRCINALACYGGAAREVLPRLREIRRVFAAKEPDHKNLPELDKLIIAIEADQHPPTLQSVPDFIRSQAQPQ